MKKILFLLLAISLISCSKYEFDDELIDEIEEQDYSSFLRVRTPRITAQINSQHIDWRYGVRQFQMSTGHHFGNATNSETNPERILDFSLSNDGGKNQLMFLTPPVDTSDQTEVFTVFGNGEKQIGELFKDFYISIRKDNNFYKSNPNNTEKLEILKTEEVEGTYDSNALLVWIRIDHIVLENNKPNEESLELKNLFLVAELVGYKFE